MFDWAMNMPLIPAGKHTVTTGTAQNMPEYGVFSEYRITFFFCFLQPHYHSKMIGYIF